VTTWQAAAGVWSESRNAWGTATIDIVLVLLNDAPTAYHNNEQFAA
jgi:hypothetical protein